MTPLIRLAARLPVQVPATPDAEQARRSARSELSKQVYQERPHLLRRALDWFASLFDPATLVPGAPAWLSVLVVGLAVALLAGTLVLLVRKVGGARSRPPASAPVFDDARGSRELEAAADLARRQGNWDRAVVERFRAMVRLLDEHGLIEDFPGMTAYEAGQAAASGLADLAAELTWAASLFDSVRYGRARAHDQHDRRMGLLAAQVHQAVLGSTIQARP